MLKRKSILALTIVLLSMFMVTACGGGAGTEDIVIGGGGTGGSWYLLGAQITEVLGNELPDTNITAVEGGAISNVRLVNEGVDLDIGMAALPDILAARAGKGAFADDDIDNVYAIMNFSADIVLFTVRADSGIDSFEDLSDKVILPGPAGWGIEGITRDVMELYGMTYDSVKAAGGDINHVSWGEAPSLINDGHADMVAFKGSSPNANIMEMEANNPAKILPISQDVMNDFIEMYPGYYEVEIPAGEYKGQEQDVVTLGHTSILFANGDVSEDFVYELTKSLLENADTYNSIKGLIIGQDPLYGIDTELLHPGARKYYEENGYL